jgi:hypothetical protein
MTSRRSSDNFIPDSIKIAVIICLTYQTNHANEPSYREYTRKESWPKGTDINKEKALLLTSSRSINPVCLKSYNLNATEKNPDR